MHIVIIEENTVIRQGLQHLLKSSDEFKKITTYSRCESLLEEVKELKPDIIILGFIPRSSNNLISLRKLKLTFQNSMILVSLVYEDDELVFNSFSSGASGYILKNSSSIKILETIKDIKDKKANMSVQMAKHILEYVQRSKNLKNGNANSLTPTENNLLKVLSEGNNLHALSAVTSNTIDQIKSSFYNIYRKVGTV